MKKLKKILPRVKAVKALPDHHLWIEFTDGARRIVDLRSYLEAPAFRALREESLFAQARIDPVSRTVCWPGGIDFDPDVLRGDGSTIVSSDRKEPAEDLRRFAKLLASRVPVARHSRKRSPRKARHPVRSGGWRGPESLNDLVRQVKD